MKNKKGKAQQTQIKQIQSNLNLKKEYVSLKKEKNEVEEFINQRKNNQVGIQAGSRTPKEMLCVAFKFNKCSKGDKCPFSHDRSLLEKSSKTKDNLKNTDQQVDDEDQNLEKKQKQVNYTKIICKYFIEACENKKYGFFWKCPSGHKCIYVHHLPEGYILKRDKKAMDDQQKKIDAELEEMTIEEYIDEEVLLKSFPFFRK
ncbi:MAG: hypothetical protein MHPSP_001764 [Paramarteilia canceri]